MINLAIIGCAGRSYHDLNNLSSKLMLRVETAVLRYIKEVIKKPKKEIILVSGGSAWIDHIAIKLFSKYNFLIIVCYCRFFILE